MVDGNQSKGSLKEVAEQDSFNVRISVSDGDTLGSDTSHGSSPCDNDGVNVVKPSVKEELAN